MKSAAWILLGVGVATIAMSVGTVDAISVRFLAEMIIGSYLAYIGYALMDGRRNAWKQALVLSLGLGLIRALRATVIAYTSPWPITSAPTGIRYVIVWNAGIAIALGIAALSILVEHRRARVARQESVVDVQRD